MQPRLMPCLALVAACGTATATQPSKGSTTPLAAAPRDEAPPHVFTPRPHRSHARPIPATPPLSSLPALVDRTRQCFAPERDDWSGGGATPPPPSKRSKSKSKGKPKKPGFVPYTPTPSSAPTGGASGAGATVSKTPEAKPTAPAKETKKRAPKSDPADAADVAVATPTPDPEPAVNEAPSGADDEMRRVEESGESRAPLTIAQTDPDDQYRDWGASIYLSNDDSMSLSSAQRVIHAIDHFLPLPAAHIRPHELLNYFSFETAPVAESDDFSVHASVAPDPDEPGIYSLALAVKGRPMTVEDRHNANLAFVVDRSGSMSDEGRMEYVKRGLAQAVGQLKDGDLVHLVLFDHEVCTPVENFVVGRDSLAVLTKAIDALQPRGATDLHLGLTHGYAIADKAYQPGYSNRVVMVTDALTNTGVTDPAMIATVGKYYDQRRIRLSGVGVGTEFNDELLDRLTEHGKGAYVFLGSEAEVDAVFGPRFVSLIETAALDVHFQLHLPPSLRMNVFYGEESSTVKEDVQAIHYFANTSQLFLSDLMARRGQLRGQDSIMLTIEYGDPETGDALVEEYAFELASIAEDDRNVRKGRLVMHFIDGLSWMASRPESGSRGMPASWEDADAWQTCQEGSEDLDRMSRGLDDDPEVRRVLSLWDKYCARYSQPRHPVKRPAAQDTWPGAAG